MKKSILCFVLANWLVSLASGDQFGTSCDPNTIQLDGLILTADCLNVVKDMTCSRLDLGKCLKNRYGSIQDDPTGEGYENRHPFLGRLSSHSSGAGTLWLTAEMQSKYLERMLVGYCGTWFC